MHSVRLALFFCLVVKLQFASAQLLDYPVYLDYLQQHAQSPEQYLAGKFGDFDIVLLGENHGVKENLDFMAQLIPVLYRAGVYNLGMEFGAVEMQDQLDALLAAPVYDQQAARDMFYYYNVGWAYQEYQNLYKAAWELNRQLPAGSKKFRIVNLSYQYHWQGFEPPRTPENMARIFYRGTPDQFRAAVVEKEILAKGEKAVLLVGYPHAFTRYKMPQFDANKDNFCDYDDGWLGNRLHKKYPGRVTNVLFHAPFYNKPNQKPELLSPAGGAIEAIMNANGNKPLGFDLNNGSPLGQLPDQSMYSTCYPGFTLGQFFDAYIFLKPIHQLHGATIDADFFTGKTWEQTALQLPDPDWHAKVNTFEEYWQQIKNTVDYPGQYAPMINQAMQIPSTGTIQRYNNFPSQFIRPRNVEVWLPADYNKNKKYAVLYMHDGQMLFDATINWNHQEWDVETSLSNLRSAGKITDCIVVGMWNTNATRWREYFPAKAMMYLPDSLKKQIETHPYLGLPESDQYLQFITRELKPFIDKTYPTYADRDHTFIAGSSMGGLISLYAICEYPEVFGGAACLSTHWPGVVPAASDAFPKAFQAYLRASLPSPGHHRIYFDYGTATLDSDYKPHQEIVDGILKMKKYTGKNWITRAFKGEDHSENAWRKRLHIPLAFLLK